MNCLRHGEVQLLSTVNNTVQGAIHYLSCGCFGTAEQLRDPQYDPKPPAAPDPRVGELEAQVAAHADTIAAHEDTIATHVATVEELQAQLAAKDEQIAALQAQVPQPVATPAAEAHAEAIGVDLTQVEGTGVDGKITKPDVVAAAEAATADAGATDTTTPEQAS